MSNWIKFILHVAKIANIIWIEDALQHLQETLPFQLHHQ